MKRKRNEVYVAGYCFTLNRRTVTMPTYCIKTSDIPKEELPKWYEAQQQLEGDFPPNDWPKYIFSYDYVYLKTDYEPLLIGSYISPTNSIPLTLSILKSTLR